MASILVVPGFPFFDVHALLVLKSEVALKILTQAIVTSAFVIDTHPANCQVANHLLV